MASCFAICLPSAVAPKVAFITDPEGNLAYFDACVALSQGVELEGDGPQKEIRLKDGWVLVFGGDVCDKADGSLELTRRLVSARKRYPQRVYLIVGNRDLNKLRLIKELSPEAMDKEPPIPYGSPKNTTTYSAFLAKLGAAENIPGCAEGSPLPTEAWRLLNTKANRLRWILDCTMGAQGDFERRRAEVAALAPDPSAPVSDDAVVESFAAAVRAGGDQLEYLRKGALAVGIHGTLFVHGGLMSASYAANADKFVTEEEGSFQGEPVTDGGFESALGCVPGVAARYNDVNTWLAKLNLWLQAAVDKAVEDPGHVDALRGQQYASYGTWPSVITGRHLNGRSQPVSMPSSLSEALLAAGYSRLVIGHTPVGQCPTVVPGAVQTVMADTSYSDIKAPDTRGAAASVIEIQGDRLEVNGRLADGQGICYTVYSGAAKGDAAAEHDPLIGAGDYAGWWVKARLAAPTAPRRYLLCKVDGFKYEYEVKEEDAARKAVGM